jgi:hypothetical protein
VLDYNACAALSGIYRGDNITCANANCPQPGACCFADGSCQALNSVQCAAQSGVYRGDGIPCASANCPQPGACCLADGTCSFVLATACATRTGVYRGANVQCGSVTCPQPFDWETQHGDSGETRATAAVALGSGALPGIVGSYLGSDQDTDLFAIQICDPASFKASCTTWAGFDTMMWLFREDGTGVECDDDTSAGTESAITNAHVTAPGRYYIAVSPFQREPRGATTQGTMWSSYAQNQVPNGPAAAESLGDWILTQTETGNTGFYTIAFNGVCYIDHPCYANCDTSTTVPCLNVLDFSCFLNAFAAGNTYANCDNSTTAPVLNVLDFSCFLNRFAAGCSSC